ncbi:MAG: hypothetical protein H0X24_18025 [Ktedonobacterales bacterium]|nr:hypothetical protein [Ktedonobacterales bacterium]
MQPNQRPPIYTPRGIQDAAKDNNASEASRRRRIRTPALVILLGSTPAIAGLELCQQLLAHNDLDRRRVALVYIDTDAVPNEVQAFRQRHKGMFNEVDQPISVPSGVQYASMPDDAMHTFIANRIPKYFASGAGGIRNNGHVAAAFNFQRIQQAIKEGIDKIAFLGTSGDEERVFEMQANIVTFLGGGTGSGIIGDVATMVRQELEDRGYFQRVNLFCMLPESIKGAVQNDISWRNSNATATLLELMALSVVTREKVFAEQRAGVNAARTYRKKLLHETFELGDQNAVANEIYLIGNTHVGSAKDSARIVGLDLYQRIVDGSGVGEMEHSKWVDRRVLADHDDRGLALVFGTTCPLEARFPVRETALAFAQISAAALLPYLVPTSAPVAEVPTNEMTRAWGDHWALAGKLVDRTTNAAEDKYAVQMPVIFNPGVFAYPTDQTLEIRHQEYRDAMADFYQRLDTAIKAFKYDEEKRIDTTPPASANDGSTTVIGRRYSHLLGLEQEYEYVLRELENEDEIDAPREYDENSLHGLKQDLTRRDGWGGIPLPGEPPEFMTRPRTQRRTDALLQAFNYNIGNVPRFERRKQLKDVLRQLIQQVQDVMSREKGWFDGEELNRTIAQYAMDGRQSLAWQGKLDSRHAHQFHVFDIPELGDRVGQRNLAIERIYWATTIKSGHEVSTNHVAIDEFNDATRDYYIQQFRQYLHDVNQTDTVQTRSREITAADLEAYGRQRLPARVVDFFTREYTNELMKHNLFSLIEIGLGTSNFEPISGVFLTHLGRMRQLMGEMIVQEESLYRGGPAGLMQTLYLGINCEDGAPDRQIIDQAIDRMGPMTRRNISPTFNQLHDPHRLQLVYGLHGVSLSTIRAFYRDSQSMMADYLFHEGAWMGEDMHLSGANWAGYPRNWPQYGQKGMPVHNSGEMEQLVTDPTAMHYQGPHSSYGASLLGRVIREEQDPMNPSTNGNGNGNGAYPPPAPRGGTPGYQPPDPRYNGGFGPNDPPNGGTSYNPGRDPRQGF